MEEEAAEAGDDDGDEAGGGGGVVSVAAGRSGWWWCWRRCGAGLWSRPGLLEGGASEEAYQKTGADLVLCAGALRVRRGGSVSWRFVWSQLRSRWARPVFASIVSMVARGSEGAFGACLRESRLGWGRSGI